MARDLFLGQHRLERLQIREELRRESLVQLEEADLAERLEVSRQSVNAIETGKFDPSLPLAFKLARLFETTIEAIFTDEN